MFKQVILCKRILERWNLLIMHKTDCTRLEPYEPKYLWNNISESDIGNERWQEQFIRVIEEPNTREIIK